jgi:ribosomal protein S18 acetylase RimI-like enzyme
MEAINIRNISLHDIETLQKICRQTFSETFSVYNTEENMNTYLEEGFSTEKLTNELINPDSVFYFAEQTGTVIGYLKLNMGASQTELKDNQALEIERIYVLKEYHGKKVGQLLYEKAIQVAKQKKVNYIWLGV